MYVLPLKSAKLVSVFVPFSVPMLVRAPVPVLREYRVPLELTSVCPVSGE
jgi:hypothetical protein